MFSQTKKLNVHRRLSDGGQVLVGQLAQNSRQVFFQYDSDYLTHHNSLSPLKLPFNNSLSSAPQYPHSGLHGVFADSLPDGWGLLLMDRVFRQQGISPDQITPMDRLAYTGHNGMGALTYSPVFEWNNSPIACGVDLATLGHQAVQIFAGETETVLAALAQAGGSGGARPKALIYFDPANPAQVSTYPQDDLEAWLVKFTSNKLRLGNAEGICEAVWLTMANNAGIDVPVWRLLAAQPNTDNRWLAVKRFDCCQQKSNIIGRYHMHSVAGLLDADFRQPALDYADLIKVGQVLCRSAAVGQQIFTRAMFNLFALNQDDHAKNWSFIQDDAGGWQLSPFYDVTYSPNPHNQHITAFGGYGNQPPLKVVQHLAAQANFSWKEAQGVISRVVDSISQLQVIAQDLGVDKKLMAVIVQRLNDVYEENSMLLRKM